MGISNTNMSVLTNCENEYVVNTSV